MDADGWMLLFVILLWRRYGRLLRFDGLCVQVYRSKAVTLLLTPALINTGELGKETNQSRTTLTVPILCVMRFIVHLHVLYMSPNLSNWIVTTMFTQGPLHVIIAMGTFLSTLFSADVATLLQGLLCVWLYGEYYVNSAIEVLPFNFGLNWLTWIQTHIPLKETRTVGKGHEGKYKPNHT